MGRVGLGCMLWVDILLQKKKLYFSVFATLLFITWLLLLFRMSVSPIEVSSVVMRKDCHLSDHLLLLDIWDPELVLVVMLLLQVWTC